MNKDIEKAIESFKKRNRGLKYNPVCQDVPKRVNKQNYEIARNDLAIAALEKQLNNGWISTVEKLPDKGGYYLVSTKCETPRVMIGFYFKDLNLWNYWMSTLEIKSVIAWQPLSEQYKEDETNELR